MEADTDRPRDEAKAVGEAEREPARELGNVLLAATIHELRERAERLHEAQRELDAQKLRLSEAEGAVRAERARYRELFDLAPDPWLLTDANGQIVEANDHAAEFFGVETRFLAGSSLGTFVEHPARDASGSELDQLLATRHRRTGELRIVPHERDPLDVEATVAVVPERADQGALLWLFRDVSERVGAARRLGETLSARTAELEATRRQAERERVHLRDLFERLQEGVVVIDASVRVAYANGAAKHLFLPARVVEGESLPEPWPDVRLTELARTLFTRRPVRSEVHVENAAGRLLSMRGIPALGFDTAGLVITDVSTRERRERAEREFVANAAHELRTPLTAISGAIEVLQRGAKEDQAQRDRFLGHIERECARLGRLTTSLLVLARAQMGVESPRLELVEVRPLLEQAAEEMRPAHGVRIDVSCPHDLAVFANRALVEQALANLASNAAKHTHRGTISLHGLTEDERWVALEIIDTGQGVRPEDQERVSERFYRAGGEPGFGLGLAIAAEAAKALGGRLDFDSQPGSGTKARIVLPSAQVVASE